MLFKRKLTGVFTTFVTKFYAKYTDNLSKTGCLQIRFSGSVSIKDAQKAISKQTKEPMTSASTLTDTYGRHHTYLRISLTERCNLRCKYCMPEEGVPLQKQSNLLTNDEIFYLAEIFAEEGIRKIRLTGGEPTVRRDIVDIIEKIKQIPKIEHVGITTNGLMLTRLLVPMQRAGLNSLNISLDTMQSSRFSAITRRKGWERVIAGIDLAIQLGFKPKINCVLMRDFNDNEICDFVKFTRDRNVDVRFIEYMPFSGNKWQTDKLITFKETLEIIRKTWPDFQALPNGPNDTSKAYAVPHYKGQVGFITSMTEHFCGTCNRLRLTADGNIKVCLFGNKEISLRDAIRGKCSKEELVAVISAAVKRKKKQHAASHQIDQNKVITQNQQKTYLMSKSSHIPFAFDSSLHLLLHSRNCCSSSRKLTHVDEKGQAAMVDVTDKQPSHREATAQAIVDVGAYTASLIAANSLSKGDVLSLAELAGIMGAKRTSELIPLCHNITLGSIKVNAALEEEQVIITASVRCCSYTGVEMEALTAAAVAALTVYDMCKAVSHDITIQRIRLWKKSGGKRDFQRKS